MGKALAKTSINASGPTSSLYAKLCALPEGLTGEIIGDKLYTEPRPTIPHIRVVTRLVQRIGLAYDDGGESGPGGWWIMVEPEVHLMRDVEVVVPDLAGWRRERMPMLPRGHRVEIAPDWVCEVLSPGTRSKDRELKMPLYAKYGVAYLWLIDPDVKRLEAYELKEGKWVELGVYEGAAEARIPPFDAIILRLADLWVG